MFATRIAGNAAASSTAQDAADIHRSAYNAAFYELGLKWHWDADHYENALPASEEKAHLRSYLQAHQPHLLKAYDAEFLVEAIVNTKQRCHEALIMSGNTRPDINWAEMQQMQVGV